MRILVSAYACEPNRGSEPEVGWNWVLELARAGHDVWVLTRKNNELAIQTELEKQGLMSNLHFLYFDLPHRLSFWKRGLQGVHFYYLLWQIGVLFVALKAHKAVQFERIHHVTFVSIRQPSFLGLLGVPFIFGPVSGGERAPYRLRASYPIRGWIKDWLRDILNLLIWVDPLMHLTFATAKRIYTTTNDTRRLIPIWYREKSHVHLAIGLHSVSAGSLQQKSDDRLQVLYVGNLLYLKGIHLALHSFARFLLTNSNAHFTLIGSGPDQVWLKSIATDLNLSNQITWIEHMPRERLLTQYSQYDVLLFPSLHDSGGMVVLEALAQGLSVICLDIGGPGQIVTPTCGQVISTNEKTEANVVDDVKNALEYIAGFSPVEKQSMYESAISRAKEFLWTKVIQELSNVD